MKLNKWPETELEYWAAIESLGGFMHRMNHGLAHGRIDDESGGVASDIMDAQEIQQKLAAEITEKFGVCHETADGERVGRNGIDGEWPELPENGKIWYWQWYEKMKVEAFRPDYEGSVCGACPFAGSLHKFATHHSHPCEIFPGMLNRLTVPHECAMIGDRFGDPLMGEDEFFSQMAEKYGDWAVNGWKSHRDKLVNLIVLKGTTKPEPAVQ
jgi:hypothetical protein